MTPPSSLALHATPEALLAWPSKPAHAGLEPRPAPPQGGRPPAARQSRFRGGKLGRGLRDRAPLLAVTVAVLAAMLLAGCKDEPARSRKPQSMRLLPDTPPPPPPKPEERPPKPADKPLAQDQPKPADAPQEQALKSDEAAGNGPGSGLAAGTVTQDYRGGAIGNAASAPQVGGGRLAAATYASAATRALNDFLQREKDLRRLDYRLQVHLWLQADGRVQRSELLGSSGDPQVDEALRDALRRFPGTATPPPERLPQPLRVQVSNRMMG